MFYKKVSDYCKNNNLSIAEFEKKCGIGNGTVGRWKDDNSKPTMHTLLKIAHTTGISVEKWTVEDQNRA